MIAEYYGELDMFRIMTSDTDYIITPDQMRELMETGQYAVAKRFELTGRITV